MLPFLPTFFPEGSICVSLLFSVAAADPLELDGGEGDPAFLGLGAHAGSLRRWKGPLNPGEAQPPNFRSALH